MSAHVREVATESPATALAPNGDNGALEIFRQVIASLELELDRHPVIGITSSISGEGRSTVALGIALALSTDLDSAVTLVDADFEHESLAKHFDLKSRHGLADLLRGVRHINDVVYPMTDTLSVVPSGFPGGDAAGLLRRLPDDDPFRSPLWPKGVVVVDLPPILNHGYSSLTANVADALILVVRARITPGDIVREAIARLESRPPAGIVFNGAGSALPSWWPGPRY